MVDQMSCMLASVAVAFAAPTVDVCTEAANCAVSGNGKAGLSIFPFGLRGMRVRGTKTTVIVVNR